MEDDIFKSISASAVLVSILKTIGSVDVPQEHFLNAVSNYEELSVSYNEEEKMFNFALRDNNE